MALVLFESGRKLYNYRAADVHDEDFVQRLFGTYAIMTIVVLSILTTPGQYFSTPITCWSSFGSPQGSYFDRKCLIGGTYPLPKNQHVESYHTRNRLHWYPFTPLIVILQALPFIIVTLIWKSCNRTIGIEIAKATEAAKSIETVNEISYANTENHVLDYICENLQVLQKSNLPPTELNVHNQGRCWWLRRRISRVHNSGDKSSLSNALLTVKFLNIVAILFNVFMLSYILGWEYLFIGVKFFYRMSLSRSVLFEDMFPIIVMCEQVNVVGINNAKTNKYACVLNLNVFNEKVFLFLWFMYLTLLVLAIIDLVQTFAFQCSARVKYEHLFTYLPVARTQSQIAEQRRFFANYGSNDCFTVLRIMAAHVDHWTMTQLCSKFYTEYQKQMTQMKAHDDVNIHDPSSSENHDMDNQIDDMNNLTRRSVIPPPVFVRNGQAASPKSGST